MKSSSIYYDGNYYSWCGLAIKTGIAESTLRHRIVNCGMTVEQAIAAGSGRKLRRGALYSYHGEQLTLKEIAKRSGRCYDLIRRKMVEGMSAEEAADIVLSIAETNAEKKIVREKIYISAIKNMSKSERQRYDAAMAICRTIAFGDAYAFRFRCVEPMRLYAFESDLLSYEIAFDGRFATLTAKYRQHNAPSDLHRRYLVIGEKVKEVNG